MHINPTNNSVGLEILKSGFWFWKKITLIANFSNGEKQQVTFSHKGLFNNIAHLQNGDMVDYNNNLRRIAQNDNELYLYFKPVKHCDLIVVLKQDLLQAIK